MSTEGRYLLVLSTCPDTVVAKQIANELVMQGLAACVQIMPNIQSWFRWKGKVDSADEHLLLIKTATERYAELEQRIISLHPYELPEIIAVPISTGFAGYFSWIDSNTKAS